MHRRPPQRLPGFNYVGKYRYSLRFCTENRARVLARDDVVTLVLSQFLRAALETRMALVAYCFMPDHVHLLVEGTSRDSDCRRFIVLAKQYSAFCYVQRSAGTRLWQRYAFERVLREGESTVELARYILANPVRAGLSACVQDYPYVGSTVYTVRALMEAVQDLPVTSG